jgi:carboxypeptidase T
VRSLREDAGGGKAVGNTTDWSYGIPSLTIELRLPMFGDGGFIRPLDQILPTWEENRPAAFEFIAQCL